MTEPSRDRYVSEAILYHVNKTSTPEVKHAPRYWGRGIYYIGLDRCMYQYVSMAGNNECVKMMDLPEWMESYSSIASRRKGVNV